MNQPPLNPDALCKAAEALYNENPWQKEVWHNTFWVWEDLEEENQDDFRRDAEVVIHAYLAAAQPEVNSVEELDALPVGSVILDSDPCVLQMVEKSSIVGSEWAIANAEHIYTTGKITLPARVLYCPEVKP